MIFSTLFVSAMVLLGCYVSGNHGGREKSSDLKSYYIYDCKIRAGKFTSHPIQRVEKPDCAVWRTPLILPIGGEKLEKMMDFKKDVHHPDISQKIADHLIMLSNAGYNVFIIGYWHVDPDEMISSLNNFFDNMRGAVKIQEKIKIADTDGNNFGKFFPRDNGKDASISDADLPIDEEESIVSYLKKL